MSDFHDDPEFRVSPLDRLERAVENSASSIEARLDDMSDRIDELEQAVRAIRSTGTEPGVVYMFVLILLGLGFIAWSILAN